MPVPRLPPRRGRARCQLCVMFEKPVGAWLCHCAFVRVNLALNDGARSGSLIAARQHAGLNAASDDDQQR